MKHPGKNDDSYSLIIVGTPANIAQSFDLIMPGPLFYM